MSIKKAYQGIVAFLEENGEKKVKSVIAEVIVMASAKVGGGGGKSTAFHKDDKGIVTAIRCYYHNLWMSPQVVEFGNKASSATGLNSMCKAGVSKWTKRERTYKQAKEALLNQIIAGEIEQSALAGALQKLDDAKLVVIPMEDGYGFETLEDCLADLANR